jgi:hypothetical protein
MDSDLPSRDFLNDRFAPKLSDQDGEIHTVCVGRPLGIDLVEAALNGINVHVYGNNVDDVARVVAHGLRLGGFARLPGLARRYIHLHAPLQPTGGSLEEIRATKHRWVEEFSRYDAGWSYVKRPLPWPRLEDEAVVPNRHATYLLAGLPIIAERLPGYYRYDSLNQHRVAIDFCRDYAQLAVQLRDRSKLGEFSENVRRCRELFTFDATLDALIEYFQNVSDRYRTKATSARSVSVNPPHERVQLFTRPLSFSTLLKEKRLPGGLASRVRLALQIAGSRARWLFASIMGKAYVAGALKDSQQKQAIEVKGPSP